MEIAYCGLNCSECPLFIATETNDEELKKKLAKDCSTDTCKFEAKDMNCKGCHSAEGASEKMCGDCAIRKCGTAKSVPHCAICSEYPCKNIDIYVQPESDNRKRLDELAKK